MTVLTEDTPREYFFGDEQEYPVCAGETIFEGGAVGEDGAGYSRSLQGEDVFQGFAVAKVDNSNGGNGDKTVGVRRRGVVRLKVANDTGVTDNDHVYVYAKNDGQFTTTAAGHTLIGVCQRWDGSTDMVVFFDADMVAMRAGLT